MYRTLIDLEAIKCKVFYRWSGVIRIQMFSGSCFTDTIELAQLISFEGLNCYRLFNYHCTEVITHDHAIGVVQSLSEAKAVRS
uniref:Uncharacterized protein n=1 Tax=Setaria digitata TaxID=48799 RepID=A0A915PXT4_9BILA